MTLPDPIGLTADVMAGLDRLLERLCDRLSAAQAGARKLRLELRRIVLSGMVFVVILAALAFLVTEAVVQLGLASPIEGFLAFAPGGQAEMTVLAIVAGADLGFVVVHHLARLTLVILGAPIFAAVMGLRKKRDRRPE